MSYPLVDADDDAVTPLTPDERDELIPSYITTRDQLAAASEPLDFTSPLAPLRA